MKNVAILVETSLASGRDILHGISRFLHERDRWFVFHQTGPLGSLNPEALKAWQGDGVIARIANRSIHRIVSQKNVPVVDVLGNVAKSHFPTVTCDEAAISGLVVAHLRGRAFRHFAFFGLENEGWSVRRRQSFEAQISGLPETTFSALMIKHEEKTKVSWLRYLRRLCDWIERLPRPLGLMVGSDQFGPDIAEACRHLGLMIPEEVAIVGVDNDPPFCEICMPRLSSVIPNHELVGYEAARLLERMMAGQSAPSEPVVIPPLHLEVRRSSEYSALEDQCLVKAMNLIRQRTGSPLGVDEVARKAGLSRSVLQRRFRATLGASVHEVITHTRLSRAKEMLGNTDLPLTEIAERSGFTHQEYLGYVFRRHTGVTPARYRQRLRGQKRHLRNTAPFVAKPSY